MKYTKNIHNKLLLDGFEFIEEFAGEDLGEPIECTTYRKGLLEVTVCDSVKSVIVLLDADSVDLSSLNYTQLKRLDKLVNSEN